MRLRTVLATAALALTVTTGLATPAQAATPPKHNVLREWCAPYGAAHALTRDCVVTASNESRTLIVRNHAGHRVNLSNPRKAVRYLTAHATVCAEEDSNACFWNAGTRGNGRGSTFFVIGSGRYWSKDLPQYGSGTLVYLTDVTR